MFKTLFLPFLFVKKYAGTGGSEEGSSPMIRLAITGFWKGNSGFVKKEKKNVLLQLAASFRRWEWGGRFLGKFGCAGEVSCFLWAD